ncbi:MAG: [LysW]-lysine hydrolase [Anaerolineaceae bacterium]|nr:[LysW]-lysine hydrolase [Anaerolineaceae bacterium]
MNELDLLTQLVQHYSPTGSEAAAVNFLVERMTAAGFKARVDSTGNAVGVLGEGPREVVLLGHIDTVPGEIPVHVEDGLLYGRGSVDAKGPLACFAAAAARLGPRPGWRLVVIGALGEEGDSRGARGILDEYRPDFLIVGEPSGWERVTLGYKGSAWYRYTVRRALTHTAARDISSCEAAVDFWNRVTTWAAAQNAGQERAFTQVAPGLRNMRSDSDGFIETAELSLNFRLPPGLAPAALDEALRALAEDGELTCLDGIPAYRADKNTPLVRAMLAGIRAAGGTPGFTLKTGTADLNLAAPAWGCPAVAYGPGDSNLDHTPHEHIDTAEFIRGVDVLEAALRNLTVES